MPRTVFIALAIIVTSVLTLLAWVEFAPPPRRPNISVTFLGYTNDTTGSQLATFAVSNLSRHAVLQQPFYEVLWKAPTNSTGWGFFRSRTLIPANPVLNSGAFRIFNVRPPTNQSPWLLRVTIYPDLIPAQAVKFTAFRFLDMLGLRPRYRVVWYAFESNWVEHR